MFRESKAAIATAKNSAPTVHNPSKEKLEQPSTMPIAGTRQSPINLCKDKVMHDPVLNPSFIKFNYRLGDCTDVVVHENGWTVNVKPDCMSTYTAQHIPGSYRLAQFHAHWGSDGHNGSEHLLEGNALSGEVHFVFWNTKYASFNHATAHGDGLAVLGVFLEESQHDNPIYEPLVDCVKKAQKSKEPVPFPANVDIETMLPKNREFWTYLGSLTTVPYNECVIWTVLKHPMHMSHTQMGVFREIINDNSRTPQDLAGRQVRCSFE